MASAALDRRSYRGLILANGLRVLLASDAAAAKGAASMDVQVGYMSDPSALPGLAHFCEHMLFLGTKPFPDEGEFERLVAGGGGSNSEETAAEETNYYFDVNGDTLEPTLARFAGFFTAPLFTASATAREVNAIDSEHSKNLQSDFWRYEQLFKLRADPSHPFGKFGTGNRKTLADGDSGARDALLSFHARYYQADRMSLALIGPQSLDKLQQLAVTNFAKVPTTTPPLPPSSDEYDGLPLPFRPAEASPVATLMVPVNELRSLKVVWRVRVTDLPQWLDSKPEELWELLLATAPRRAAAVAQEAGAGVLARGGRGGVYAVMDPTLCRRQPDAARADQMASRLVAALCLPSHARLVGCPLLSGRRIRSLAKTSFTYAEPQEVTLTRQPALT